jgi:hypothetical protein
MQDTLGMLLICDDEWRYIMDEWLNDEITITNFRQSSWFLFRLHGNHRFNWRLVHR